MFEKIIASITVDDVLKARGLDVEKYKNVEHEIAADREAVEKAMKNEEVCLNVQLKLLEIKKYIAEKAREF